MDSAVRVCLVYLDCKDDFLSNAVIYVAQEVVAALRAGGGSRIVHRYHLLLPCQK